MVVISVILYLLVGLFVTKRGLSRLKNAIEVYKNNATMGDENLKDIESVASFLSNKANYVIVFVFATVFWLPLLILIPKKKRV